MLIMSDDSGEEGPSVAGNGKLSQESAGATGTDASREMQICMQELTQLRDELVRLNEQTRAWRANANDNGVSTCSYIYVPRERQVQPFSGECGADGRCVEEFIDEAERVLRSREQTTDEQCDYILSLLCGPH